MEIGSGQKFGLIIPKKSKVIIGKSVFKKGKSDEEEENETKFNLADQSKSKTFIKKQTQLHIEGALSQDANIFDYDASYEDDKKRREEQEELKFKQVCQASKPKYMGALLQKAEERKRERLMRGERKVAKERKQEEEEGLFRDKERYETEAYKESRRKMQEEQKEREEALQEAEPGDFSGFYKHLFDQKTNSEAKKEEKSDLKMSRFVIKEEKKEMHKDVAKKARIENGERRNKEEERNRDKEGIKKDIKNKRVADKDNKIEKNRNLKDNMGTDLHTKLLPTKRTTEVEDARARYLSRKNKVT